MLKKYSPLILVSSLCYLLNQGLFGVGSDEVSEVSEKEGGSVSLHTDVKTNRQDRIRWYFNDIRIAKINENFTKTCTDVQCKEGTVRFRGRLKLNNQTGSLTITNIRTTDSGLYLLEISSGSGRFQKTYRLNVQGYFTVNTEGVSVFLMERDSVTFQTNVETNRQSKIRWYSNNIRIAIISGDLSKICTDVQCNEGTERFRERLKLDNQTGSLTITNIRTTDSGEYHLEISGKNNGERETFKFFIHDVSAAAERDELKKKERESVTLYTGVINHHDLLRWTFNDTLLAEITGDQSEICEDVQCKERFRDRLKLDHQTGSLTITHTRTTDSGEYHQQINSSRFSISRSFTVSVTDPAVGDPGPPSVTAGETTAAVICWVVAIVLLIAAVSAVIYGCTQAKRKDMDFQNKQDEENGTKETFLPGQMYTQLESVGNGGSTNQTEDLSLGNGTE